MQEDNENSIENFHELAFNCLVTAINRQYLSQQDLFQKNGYCIQNLINPTMKDIIQRMYHSALQTKLVELFQLEAKNSNTYINTMQDIYEKQNTAFKKKAARKTSTAPRTPYERRTK